MEERDREPSAVETLLLVLTVVGFLVPNALVVWFMARHGLDLGRYFSLWFDSLPTAQLFADLLIASLALFAWAAVDGPRRGLRLWWVCIPATLLVGLCFGLPLYLWMRERATTG